jgi:aminoglycoside phosphotransferase (APT) family kinase protein
MHADEIETDVELVRRLLAGQFPQWAELLIELVDTYGTDHHIYRLGDELCIRLPIIGWAATQAAKEAKWLPKLAPHLPLALPVQVGIGHPAEGYPFDWSICEWLPGVSANDLITSNATTGSASSTGITIATTEHGSAERFDLEQAAIDLAAFIRALRTVDTVGAHERPHGGRGAPLAERDEAVRNAIAQLGDRIDDAAALLSWEESLNAPVWNGKETWVHGDLLPGNLLVVDGRLSSVIDWGSFNVGDPACDLQPAWSLFYEESREKFRNVLEVDDASWLRGRGWALSQAVIALPYYRESNPRIVRQVLCSIQHILSESTS